VRLPTCVPRVPTQRLEPAAADLHSLMEQLPALRALCTLELVDCRVGLGAAGALCALGTLSHVALRGCTLVCRDAGGAPDWAAWATVRTLDLCGAAVFDGAAARDLVYEVPDGDLQLGFGVFGLSGLGFLPGPRSAGTGRATDSPTD
jgi:hypothetical protein